MNAVEHVSIVIQDDFLERQTRAQPIAALAELIWNSLDGEAGRVDVEFERGDLAGGLSKIVVYDDGEGFPRSEAAKLFGNLGGSWKRLTRRTKTKNRMVHGQEGRGRYKAFALGRSVTWKVCYLDGASPERSKSRCWSPTSRMLRSQKSATRPDEQAASSSKSRISAEILKSSHRMRAFRNLPRRSPCTSSTIRMFRSTSPASVSIPRRPSRASQAAAAADQRCGGTEYPAELHLIEWRSDTKRTLYLCSENGFPLDQVETRFQVPGFSFSAYLKSPYIAALHNDGRLGLAEMVPALREAVEAAREAIKQHFRERAAQRARNVVEEWKSADIYPFKGEPATPVEKAERQVFDIVAVNVQEFTPELAAATPKARALHLRMLRHAIERGPDDLQMILREVLDLPERKQKELAALLQETTLSAIITAAKTVADRLKFIAALESIVFDPETKGRLKERSQLHKILAENTWVLGEEYNLWASDKDLKRVLEKHRAASRPRHCD